MDIMTIKKDSVCTKCKNKIFSNSNCYIKLHKSSGGPYLEILCLSCGGR